MNVKIVNPIKAILDATNQEISDLRPLLEYKNKANQHLLKRHYNNHWFKSKNKEAWEARLQELKDSVDKSLLFQENDTYYVRPGSIPYLGIELQNIANIVKYPTPKKVAWAKPLPFELHKYQQDSVDKLLEIKHGNVELTTASGKSAILLKLCRETGFNAAIIAPGKSVFNELLTQFEKYLGRNNVGTFGNGRKKIGKKFTICIGDSLVNVKPGTEEWDFFSNLDMLCVDESHEWGAETLETLCHGIFEKVPYRFFLSATQTRGDGGEKLLQSIIGKTVYTLSTQEAVKGGYICPHAFNIVELESSNPYYQSQDALDMKRAHFLKNRNIAAFIAKLCNSDATVNGRQSLVLVEELEQISMLLPLLTVNAAIAHSETRPERLAELGLHKVDTAESVEKFNKNEVQVLIGTSCIATGTNIYPTHNSINWVGGASEVKTKQGSVGRSVRLGRYNPWHKNCKEKTAARIWDFDVQGIYILEKHLQTRIEYYQDSGSEIKRIKFK